jgi:ATP-dependent Lhr-like helicase
LLAFWARDTLGMAPGPTEDTVSLDRAAEQVRDCLRHQGALFIADLAQRTGLPPTSVRAALWTLLRRRLVTNDHFDVIRRGEEPEETQAASPYPTTRIFRAGRRRPLNRPEGRWSLISWGRPEPEEQAVFLAGLLLQRYGIVARELALLDPGMLPWRLLYEVLSRMEWAGEVRRGYFVEGLSGAQFALPEAVRQLHDLDLPSSGAAPVVLVHSQDPANLYGSGAPLDIALLDGGTRPLGRRAGNWLVLRAGQPVLIIENQGRRLTALPSAQREDLAAAVACLPRILAADRGLAARHRLTVVEWNGNPVGSSEGRELLAATGFVSDYQQMTLYSTGH